MFRSLSSLKYCEVSELMVLAFLLTASWSGTAATISKSVSSTFHGTGGGTAGSENIRESEKSSSNNLSSSKMGSDRSSGDLKSWDGSGTVAEGSGREERGEGAGAEIGNGLSWGGPEDTEGVAGAAKLGLLSTRGKILPKLGAGSGSGSGSGTGIFLRKGSLSEPGSGSARGDL